MAAKKAEVLTIKPLDFEYFNVTIIGDTPLIVHAWDAKAKREILEKELGFEGKKLSKREAKDPLREFASSLYWLTPMPTELDAESIAKAFSEGARFGFPATAIKQCAVSAAFWQKWSKDKTSIRAAFNIVADTHGYYGGDLAIDWDKQEVRIVPNQFKPYDMCEIISDPPVMREDMVKVGMGTADIRYRGEFQNWQMNLKIKYNANGIYTKNDILNIIEAGGSICGIGEWRNEKDGVNGAFHVKR